MTVEEAFNLALRQHQAGQLGQAEAIYRQILAQSPGHAQAMHMLGVVAHQAGRHEAALDLVNRAVAANPDVAIFYCNLGLILAALGRWDEAIAAYEKSLARDPGLHEAHYNLGNALKEQGRADEAIDHLRRAVELRPDSYLAHNNLGNALSAKGEKDAAIAAFHRAIELRPGYADAHNNLGQNYFTMDRPDQAMDCFRRALELAPRTPGYLTNLGNALHRSRRLAEAAQAYQEALTISPQFPMAHWNLGLHHLTLGEYSQGWPDFEWRWQVKELDLPRVNLPRSPWDGSELYGRRILLHGEQGFGDVIQFIRFLPTVAEMGGKIVLACQRELLPLLRNFPHVHESVAIGQPMPDFEVYCSLLTLPGMFHTTLDTIPPAVPYILPDPELVAQWRDRLPATGRPKVGLVWSGKRTPDPYRSIPPEKLRPLWEIKLVDFVSLQAGPLARQAPPHGLAWKDDGDQLADFSQTAAAIANLDLVITIDSAVAHLAGAMGKRTWVMLKHVPDWRWMLDRTDSPWYPTMRLFRQGRHGDWDAVIAAVGSALRTFAA